MFCSKCGNQCPDGIGFCSKCGAPLGGVSEANVNVEPEVVTEQEFAPVVAPKKVNKKLIIIAGVVAVVAIVLGVLLFGGSSAESVAEEYLMADIEGDKETLFNNAIRGAEVTFEEYIENYCKAEDIDPNEYYDELSEDYDADIKDYDDYIEAAKESAKEGLIDEFGEYNISIEVISSKEMSNKELKEIKNMIKSYNYNDELYGDIDVSKIDEGCTVKFRCKIEGEDDKDSAKATVILVKYDGNWKVYSSNF